MVIFTHKINGHTYLAASMKDITKVLSHQDRVFGRIISGGCQVSPKHKTGIALVNEIERGFFEKKVINGTAVARPLHLPFTIFSTFRATPPN